MASAWDLEAELDTLRERGLFRSLRTLGSPEAAAVEVNGREVALFCSNDYLGLANDPAVREAACRAVDRWGAGSGSSRLISGNLGLHEELQERLAAWKKAERALVFSTGYHANLGVLQALVGKGDVVLSDALNHASLIDGCRLSRAEVRVYPHADLDALEHELRDAAPARRRLVVTDSIFSMDGDAAPLGEICDLAERYGAEVMVDEAHATGVVGPTGAGLVEELGLEDRVLVQMGTLGKALGSFGAYVAGSRALIELLVNRARTFVFTTGLPPAAVGAAIEGARIASTDAARRARLHENAAALRRGIGAAGFDVPDGASAIVPVLVGDAEATMRLSERLFADGVFAQGIRPPTVPPGTSRIRVTAMATHTEAHLERAIGAFRRAAGRNAA